MDARSANAAAGTVAILGLVAYIAFDGVVSGLSLFVAGLLLVAVGVWGWQGQGEAPRTAVPTGVDPGSRVTVEPGHEHDRPIVAHGDLVAHVREAHGSVPHDGSSIALRRQHDRAHAGSS